MIALYIFTGLLLILVAVLFLPLTAKIAFKESFIIKIKFAGIKVYEIDTAKQSAVKQKDNTVLKDAGEPKEKKPNFFEELKKKYGFSDAVKKIFGFAKDLLTHIKRLLRHIKINKVILNLTVSADDAAATAVEYGAVCSAAYPVLSLLSSVAEIKYKQINISADFNSRKPNFDFMLDITSRAFFLLLAALGLYKEYRKFTEEQVNNERK